MSCSDASWREHTCRACTLARACPVVLAARNCACDPGAGRLEVAS